MGTRYWQFKKCTIDPDRPAQRAPSCVTVLGASASRDLTEQHHISAVLHDTLAKINTNLITLNISRSMIPVNAGPSVSWMTCYGYSVRSMLASTRLCKNQLSNIFDVILYSWRSGSIPVIRMTLHLLAEGVLLALFRFHHSENVIRLTEADCGLSMSSTLEAWHHEK